MNGPGVADRAVLVAGVLHDVVEDTATGLDEVRARVRRGRRRARRVGDQPGADREAYLRSLAGAPERAVLLKLADRLSNVQRLETHPRPAKRASYYAETVTYFLPLAARHAWYERWYGAWRDQHAGLLG